MLRYFASFALIAAPWFVFMYMRFGNVFIERHFLFNLMGGAENGQNFAPPQWYLIYMLDMWKPLIFFAPLIMYVCVEKILKNDRTLFVPLWWFFSILIPFSLSQSKVWWYVYPLWPVFLLLIGLSLMHIKKNLWQSVFAVAVLLAALLPYWRLTISHIPLKPFMLFTFFGAGIFYFMGRYTKQKKSVLLLVLTTLVIISAYFNYVNFSRNPTENTKIKNLAQRNQDLQRISVLGIPYEAALYYFNVGNVVTSNTFYEQEKYVLYRKDSMPLELKNFTLIDQEGDLFLYKHK
jgi:4-amino-4-deoxy-L-arabinose transferase-like glycosyltransferase